MLLPGLPNECAVTRLIMKGWTIENADGIQFPFPFELSEVSKFLMRHEPNPAAIGAAMGEQVNVRMRPEDHAGDSDGQFIVSGAYFEVNRGPGDASQLSV